MSVSRFIDCADFSHEEISDLIALAHRLQHRPEPDALKDKVLGLLFLNPSLRTLASMQSGMARLGGSSFVITPGQGTWAMESRLGVKMDGVAAEHLREGLPVLAGYCDALGIRAFAQGKDLAHDVSDQDFLDMAQLTTCPLVNLESAINHPCQALADWKTLDDQAIPKHAKVVLSWVPHPRALPLAVPAAALTMAAQRGHDVVIANPEGFDLPQAVLEKAQRLAALNGGRIRQTHSQKEAFEGARVIYAKEWGTTQDYGNAEAYSVRAAQHLDWQITQASLASAGPDARLMHCLPVRRNVAVSEDVLDGPRSIVVPQAHNRLWVQMAILHRLLSRPTH